MIGLMGLKNVLNVVFVYAIVLPVLTCRLNTFQKPPLYVLYFKDYIMTI